MEKDELRSKLFAKVDELPTLPVVVPKLLNLTQSATTSASDITELISHDPALSSKILKVANSAYYGFYKEITNLTRAVALLGFNMVRSLALSVGVVRSLPSKKKSSYFSQEGLWLHSLAVATLLKEMGDKFGKGRDCDHFFIVGLLHDIGKIVLDQFFTDLFHHALEETFTSGEAELHIAERKIIGVDHGEVGAMLLTRWKFPDIISNPIAIHHQHEVPEGTNAQDVAMLRIADILSQELGLEMGGSFAFPEIPEEDLQVVDMDEEDLEDMRAYLDDAKDKIREFFGAMF